MRLGMVTPRWGPAVIGGTEYWLRLLGEHLAADLGWEVHAFTTCATSAVTWADALPPGTRVEGGVAVHRHRSVSGRSSTYAPLDAVVRRVPDLLPSAVAESFVSAVGPFNPALVDDAAGAGMDLVAVTPYLYRPAIDAVRRLGRRVVWHGAAHDEAELRLPMMPSTFEAVGGLSYNSFAERSLVEATFDVAHLPAAVVGNAVVESAGDAAAAREWIGLDADEPFVLCLGRIERVKGTHALAELWRTYRGRRPGAPRLVLLGSANQALAGDAHVVVAGTCPEDVKWGALRAAEVLVAPSSWESFSLVVIEAWLAGTPVVVNSRCPPAVEQCRRSGGGLWFDSYAEFEVALDVLLGDSGLRDRLAGRGADFARRAYAWPAILDRYSALCDRVLEPRRLRGGTPRPVRSPADARHPRVQAGCAPPAGARGRAHREPDRWCRPAPGDRRGPAGRTGGGGRRRPVAGAAAVPR